MSTTAKQQFEGTTIADALATAVSILGDDLEILDAQRIRRRRLLGIRHQERYEVTAAKRATAEPKDFEDVLQRMVERVDEAERTIGVNLADTDRAWWGDAEFVVPRHAAPPAMVPQSDLGTEDIQIDVRREPATATSARAATAANARHAAPAAPVIELEQLAAAGSVRTVTTEATPEWSRDGLLALGLPPALVGRIRPDELHDDLDWVAALARAITELLDTADAISGPCELTGHGADSAIHLLRGACDGFRLDSLIIEGRRVAATPLELALAIRSLLRSSP